jgi:hypothetical protein
MSARPSMSAQYRAVMRAVVTNLKGLRAEMHLDPNVPTSDLDAMDVLIQRLKDHPEDVPVLRGVVRRLVGDDVEPVLHIVNENNEREVR